MKQHGQRISLLVAFGVLLGCTAPEPEPPLAHDHAESAASLQTIMAGLGVDAAKLGSALWIDDFETVAASAQAIAEHPHVPETERERIAATLGAEFAGFAAEDRAVHAIAVEIAAAARRADSQVIAGRYGDLAAACVRCHITYRGRLQPGG